MTRPFFHEIDATEFAALKILRTTWGEVVRNYRAPPWCSEGQAALEGKAGCNSLVYRMIRCEADCGDCELRIKR